MRTLKINILLSSTLFVLASSCGSMAELKSLQKQSTKEDKTGDQSQASADSNGASTGNGTLSLDEPTASVDPNVKKIHLIVLNPQCKKGGEGGGHHGRRHGKDHGDREGRGDHDRGGDAFKKLGKMTDFPKMGLHDDGQRGLSDTPCLVKDVSEDFKSGGKLSVSGLATGRYSILVTLEDASGKALEQASAMVEITDGKVATANLKLSKTKTEQPTGTDGAQTTQGGLEVVVEEAK